MLDIDLIKNEDGSIDYQAIIDIRFGLHNHNVWERRTRRDRAVRIWSDPYGLKDNPFKEPPEAAFIFAPYIPRYIVDKSQRTEVPSQNGIKPKENYYKSLTKYNLENR